MDANNDSPVWLRPVLAAGALHLVFMAMYLLPYHGDASALVCLSESLRGQAPFERVRSGFKPDGYDGQFYFVIAQDPWKIQGDVIDHPSMRHARILFPVLAWLCSGGEPGALIWVMPLLNLVGVLGIAWLGTRIAMHYGRGPWWGFLLPIAINASMPAFRDLTDTLAAMAVVGLLASWLLKWPAWLTTGWAIACVLGREQNIAIVAIVGFDALLAGQWLRCAGMVGAGGIWIGWMLLLKNIYGSWPTAAVHVGGPFEGMIYRWSHLAGTSGALSIPAHVARMGLLTAQLLTLSYVAVRGERLARLLALAALGLASVAGQVIYCDAFSYCRVLNWAPLACWVWSVQAGKRWPVFILAPAAIWPVIEILKVWR